jgi:hypothetical protein
MDVMDDNKMDVKDHNKLNIRTVFRGCLIDRMVKLADS